MLKWIAAASLLLLRPGPDEDYAALVDSETAKRARMDEEMREAHRALDEGRYARAVELARHARALDEEIARIREESRACLRKLVAGLAVKLDDDDFQVREAASDKLRALGAPARPLLIRHRRAATSPESRYRLDELLPGISADPEGQVRQWASDATASSEYTPTDWSARQVTGPPDTAQGGDARTAWAAKEADGGTEWIRLTYPLAVRIVKVRIHETYVPGAVVAVDVVGPDGARQRAWEGTDPGGAAPVWVELDLGGLVGREIVIVLDTKKSPGGEEIDAVELVGELIDD